MERFPYAPREGRSSLCISGSRQLLACKLCLTDSARHLPPESGAMQSFGLPSLLLDGSGCLNPASSEVRAVGKKNSWNRFVRKEQGKRAKVGRERWVAGGWIGTQRKSPWPRDVCRIQRGLWKESSVIWPHSPDTGGWTAFISEHPALTQLSTSLAGSKQRLR